MPIALLVAGLLMIVVGVKGTQKQFGQQLLTDVAGSSGFMFWIAALGGIGAMGYIPELRKFSIGLMTLVLLAMVLSNQGVFAKLNSALAAGPAHPKAPDNSGSTVASLGSLPEIHPLTSADTAASPSDAAQNFATVANVAKMFLF